LKQEMTTIGSITEPSTCKTNSCRYAIW